MKRHYFVVTLRRSPWHHVHFRVALMAGLPSEPYPVRTNMKFATSDLRLL
jgi:hypothetical protein